MRKPTCGLYVDNIHLGSVFHHCTEVLAEIECRHDSSGRADDPVVIFSTDEEVSQARGTLQTEIVTRVGIVNVERKRRNQLPARSLQHLLLWMPPTQ